MDYRLECGDLCRLNDSRREMRCTNTWWGGRRAWCRLYALGYSSHPPPLSCTVLLVYHPAIIFALAIDACVVDRRAAA